MIFSNIKNSFYLFLILASFSHFFYLNKSHAEFLPIPDQIDKSEHLFFNDILKQDPYIDRNDFLKLSIQLCKSKNDLSRQKFIQKSTSYISKTMNQYVHTTSLKTDSNYVSITMKSVSADKNKPSAKINILFSDKTFNVTLHQNKLQDISLNELRTEPIASIQLSANCEVQSSFQTYFNKYLKPIFRAQFDSNNKLIKFIRMKAPLLTTNSTPNSNPNLNLLHSKISVGVIDSGVDYNHPALIEKMRPFIGIDLYSNDLFPYDYTNSPQNYSHGTGVADLILRDKTTKNSNIQIIPVRVYSKITAIEQAIEFLAKHNVKLVNISMGSSIEKEWEPYARAVKRHPEILFIVAAGNEFSNLEETKIFPATLKLKNQIVVGSVNKHGQLSKFSNYGKSFVHVAALGEKLNVAKSGGGTFLTNGTSYAAPLVTRIAAHFLDENPNLNSTELQHKIFEKAVMTSDLSEKVSYGLLEETLTEGIEQESNELSDLSKLSDLSISTSASSSSSAISSKNFLFP